MSKSWISAIVAVSALSMATAFGAALKHGQEASVGQPAPAWSLTDVKGATHSLSEYKGKFVVLEWTNSQCPYVQKHYGSGNMQATQKWAREHGVVWLTVVSAAPGAQGYVTSEQGRAMLTKEHSNASALLLDPTGKVGRAYEAKTTPDMMVIDPKGTLIYSGGIDDKPTTDWDDVKTAHNYVKAALEEALAGKAVTTPTSQPYGCGIKYAH